jgi:16S rRNA (guanine1207-N2)-methyltransferase
MNTLLSIPQGQFQLKRFPLRQPDLLQAWDASDEYLLTYLSSLNIKPKAQVAILNDNFGALGVALSCFQPHAITDSYLSQLATRHNLGLNKLTLDRIHFYDSLEPPQIPLDYLLIKAPKTLAFLEDQLYKLRPSLHFNSTVIVAGMLKNLPASTWKILERLIGPTHTSLAFKKSRLIFATLDPGIKVAVNPYPSSYVLENTDFLISNHANVFSRDSLDIGCRFLLAHLPAKPQYKRIIDLGCGNGLLGLCIAKLLPESHLYFVDESYMAVASAQQNFRTAFGEQRTAEFRTDDCLSSFPAESADLILCNPPFHQQQTIGDHIAKQMFQQAYKTLRNNGELRIVANRHLAYANQLKKLFGNCTTVATNPKFVILASFKRN